MSANGIVRLTDLNDFINPSQLCVKPTTIKRQSNVSKKIAYEQNGTIEEIGESGERVPLKPVSVTLSDCLACSGCITSAESVLIEQQGTVEFMDLLKNAKCNRVVPTLTVVSVSPQSIASLAANYHLSIEEASRNLDLFLKNIGVDVVLDTTLARNLSLICSGMEFVERYKLSKESKCALPILTGICPGWVCYAEKSLGEQILSMMSTVRSPQAIMGSFVKYYLLKHLHEKNLFLDYRQDEVIHVTIMPCFDKKLEASRPQFSHDDGVKEVDLVLSSTQLSQLINEQCVHFKMLHLQFNSPLPYKIEQSPYCHRGSGSGGYLEFVFAYAAKELFGKVVESVTYTPGKNKDYQEAALIVDGRPVLNMALCYGFKNIQNLVRKIRSGKCKLHYVEVMACPSGCLNGGGQIRANDDSLCGDVLQRVSDLYESVKSICPLENAFVAQLIQTWLDDLNAEKVQRYLRTNYDVLKPSNNLMLNIQW